MVSIKEPIQTTPRKIRAPWIQGNSSSKTHHVQVGSKLIFGGSKCMRFVDRWLVNKTRPPWFSDNTLPETNIAPKNGGFQYESPFPGVYFQGGVLVSGRVSRATNTSHQVVKPHIITCTHPPTLKGLLPQTKHPLFQNSHNDQLISSVFHYQISHHHFFLGRALDSQTKIPHWHSEVPKNHHGKK